jgi:hypothetical protein
VAPARGGAPIALASVLLLAFVAPGAAFASEGDFNLVLAPIGQAGPYFDLTMRPGERARFEVDLVNGGDTSMVARTYATDVFTITNGGYGGRLRDAAQTGATTWLTYPTAVLDLAAGGHVRRSLTVTVPLDAGPGEYISSLVLENDAAVRNSGGVAFDQFVRQAIAVVITVPGARQPELRLGKAHHEIVAGRSVVSVAVENSGNVRLKPIVAFVLRDATRTEISRKTFQMDTFYARTDTLVAVSLATLLPAGRYTIELALADGPQGVEANGLIDLVVGPGAGGGGVAGPGLTPVGPGGAPQSVVIALASLATVLAGLVLTGVILARSRRRAS